MSYIWEQPNRGNTLYEQAIYEATNLAVVRRFTQQGIGKYGDIAQKIKQLSPNVQIKEQPDAAKNEPGRVIFNTSDPAAKYLLDELEKDNDVEEIPTDSNNSNNIVFKLNDDGAPVIKVIVNTLKELGLKENADFRFQKPQDQGGHTTLIIAPQKDSSVIAKFKNACGKYIEDTRPENERLPEEEKQRAELIKSAIDNYPEKIQDEVALAVYFLSKGKWFDGSEAVTDWQKNIRDTFTNAIATQNADRVKEAIHHIVSMIANGKIKVDPNNTGLYSIPNIEKQVTGNIQIPSMFKAEPDDSEWNEIVITDYGIPMINLSHPAVKKVIASDNPKEDCPGDLKQFEQKVYENEGLKKVFGSGNFERILDSAVNLLTLGIAAAATDAGKRVGQIIKELKEKGGLSTHRNLLLVKYEDIVDADPENEGLTVTAKAYNRSNKTFVGELEVPIRMLSHFYSVVDPVESSKMYIEMYNNQGIGDYGFQKDNLDGDMPGKTESIAIDDGTPLFECQAGNTTNEPKKPLYEYILTAALTYGALAAAPTISGLIGQKRHNTVGDAKKGDGQKFTKLKKEYVEALSKEGHPPSYVLKPKSANKEVVVISKASTGQRHGGKVLMISLKIGEHQAACFMSPETAKKYFSF